MDDWNYDPIQKLPPDALATNSPLMNALRNQSYHWIRRWLEKRFHFQVTGAEVFGQVSQFILIANHSSHLDTICLLASLTSEQRNHCYSAAAEDYFYTNVFKEKTARLLANTFPFRRHEDALKSLEACDRILERGDSLIFYPEGTRSRNGELQPFRKGIGLLLQGKRYPVTPAYLQGAHEALAKGQLRPHVAKIHLWIGVPQRFTDAPIGKTSAAEITTQLQSIVQSLGNRR